MTAFVNWRRVVEATEDLCSCGGAVDEDACSACTIYHQLKKQAVTVRVAPAYSLSIKPATEKDLT